MGSARRGGRLACGKAEQWEADCTLNSDQSLYRSDLNFHVLWKAGDLGPGERMELSTVEREKVKNVPLSLLAMLHISGSAQELQAWFSERTWLSPNLPTKCNPLEMKSQILHLGTLWIRGKGWATPGSGSEESDPTNCKEHGQQQHSLLHPFSSAFQAAYICYTLGYDPEPWVNGNPWMKSLVLPWWWRGCSSPLPPLSAGWLVGEAVCNTALLTLWRLWERVALTEQAASHNVLRKTALAPKQAADIIIR